MDLILNRYQFFCNKNQAEIQSRQSPYCEFKLKQKLTVTNPEYVFQISVNRVSIPLQFYQFNVNNNRLNWTIIAAIPISLLNLQGTIIITPGNYTLSELITELNTKTLPSLQSQSGLFTSATWSFNFNSITNKAEYKLATNIGICTIEFSPCVISSALGFDNAWSIICNSSVFLQAPFTVNMVPISNVYVVSESLSDNTSFEALGGQIDYSQVLATVPLDYLNIHYCSVEFNNPIKIKLTIDTISSLDFSLQDSSGFELSCDQPWSLQFTIEEVHSPSISRSIKDSSRLSIEASSNMIGYSNEDPTEGSYLQKMKNQILNKAKRDWDSYVSKRQKI